MWGLLSLAVLLFPVAELFVLMRVGSRIGIWDTLFLLLFSGILGGYLARIQGQLALQRIQRCLNEGQMPTLEMLDGVLVFIGGLLFIFPGFISDAFGLLLIFPVTRWIIRGLIFQGIRTNLQARQGASGRSRPPKSPQRPKPHEDISDAEIIE